MRQYLTLKSGHTLCIHDTPGDQGTIIAVHGLTGNYKQLEHFQEAFTGRYRFISYDVRGRGNSDPASTDTSIRAHAEDLLELVETLDIKAPILMGYSMGAYICAWVASKLTQVKALILLDGAGEPDETSRKLVLPSLKRLEGVYPSEQKYVSEVKELYTKLGVSWNDVLAENVKYDVKQIDTGWEHKSESLLIEQDFESFYSFMPTEVCSRITCKTFLLIATGKIANQSPLFREEGYFKTRESIKHVQVYDMNVNHYELVFNEQPLIVSQIEAFLEVK